LQAGALTTYDVEQYRTHHEMFCITFLVHAGVDALTQTAGATLVAVYLVDSARFWFAT